MNTQVEVLVNGKPIKQYSYEGKTFIEAKINTEYTIKIRNNSYNRRLAVITVDGVSVLTGQPHIFNSVGEGYIINAYDAIEVKGFRKDVDSVGAFKFCQAGKSYCNEQGLKGNNGVIGVRIYEERQSSLVFDSSNDRYKEKNERWPEPIPYKITYTDNSYHTSTTDDSPGVIFCCCNTTSTNEPSPKFDVGTTWGKQINDKVVDAYFDTNESNYTDYIIYYDVRRNLEKIGIKFIKEKLISYPRAFNTFAKPPKGWVG